MVQLILTKVLSLIIKLSFNCHRNVCPSNICPCYICPSDYCIFKVCYNCNSSKGTLYRCCYWFYLNRTLKKVYGTILLGIFVQATFVTVYISPCWSDFYKTKKGDSLDHLWPGIAVMWILFRKQSFFSLKIPLFQLLLYQRLNRLQRYQRLQGL